MPRNLNRGHGHWPSAWHEKPNKKGQRSCPLVLKRWWQVVLVVFVHLAKKYIRRPLFFQLWLGISTFIFPYECHFSWIVSINDQYGYVCGVNLIEQFCVFSSNFYTNYCGFSKNIFFLFYTILLIRLGLLKIIVIIIIFVVYLEYSKVQPNSNFWRHFYQLTSAWFGSKVSTFESKFKGFIAEISFWAYANCGD